MKKSISGWIILAGCMTVFMRAPVALAAHHGGAGTSGHGVGHTGAPVHGGAHAGPAPARPIEGRIVAVRRLSQEITVQTRDGQNHQVKVPATTVISSRQGSHFNAVRAGQYVHLTAVNDRGHGLVAHSVAIP